MRRKKRQPTTPDGRPLEVQLGYELDKLVRHTIPGIEGSIRYQGIRLDEIIARLEERIAYLEASLTLATATRRGETTKPTAASKRQRTKPKGEKAGKAWTPEETETALRLHGQGVTSREIGRILGRSGNAVRQNLMRHRTTEGGRA